MEMGKAVSVRADEVGWDSRAVCWKNLLNEALTAIEALTIWRLGYGEVERRI